MTKKYMTKEIVKLWVQKASDERVKFERYIHLDIVENYLNANWTKEGIEFIYNKILNGEDVNKVIGKYTDYKFIF